MMLLSAGELVGIRLYSVGELVEQTKIYYTHTHTKKTILKSFLIENKTKSLFSFFLFPLSFFLFFGGAFFRPVLMTLTCHFSSSLLFRLWMLMYAYKESPFPWRDSSLQPQFVSQLHVLSDPEFAGGCRSVNMLVYFCLLFQHWLL